MRFKLPAVILLTASLASGQMTLTVEQLKSFIQSSVKIKTDDRKVAEYLQKVRLNSRLDDLTIEELQGQGAGPKTVAALKIIRDASASLPAPSALPEPVAPPKPRPAPSDEDQKKALAEATDYALNYEKSLPNFICTQVTRRYGDPSNSGAYHALDTINEQLSYFEHHEDYKVISRNNQPVTVSHDKLQGAKSSGEFGSILREIFAPHTETQFAWERWTTLRGELTQVYSYRVPLSTSNYHIDLQEEGKNITVGYSGSIFLDKDHHFVHRITFKAEDIPAGFPVQELTIKLDYDFKPIGDAEYLLPLQFELMSREGRMAVKNDVDFHFYRKFGTESTIKFDTPPPVDVDKPTEKKKP